MDDSAIEEACNDLRATLLFLADHPGSETAYDKVNDEIGNISALVDSLVK